MNDPSKLALYGGEKEITFKMPSRKSFGIKEKSAVLSVIDYYTDLDDDPGYFGYFEKKYCNAFNQYMGGGYSNAVSTGTGAIYVAIAALELPADSEVVISPITDPGSFNAIVLNGLKVSLADSEPNSLNTSWKQIEKVISDKTSAILIVHCAGISTDIDAIVYHANRLGIKVIEDCSQAPGGMFNGCKLGTFGDIAAFSTMYRKSLATGGSGGLVYTSNELIHSKVLSYADRGKDLTSSSFEERNAEKYLFPALNWNINEFSCAIGFASLQRLDRTVAKRNEFVAYFSGLVQSELHICSVSPFVEGNSPFFLRVLFNEDRAKCSKSIFCNALLAEGVELNPHYRFVISQWSWALPYITVNKETPNAVHARNVSFNVYLNENYNMQTADVIIKAIKKVEKHFAL